MVERMAVRGGWRLLLYLTFCIYLVREILFLSGKSQGILKTHVCGNYARSNRRYKLRFHCGSIAENAPILSSGV